MKKELRFFSQLVEKLIQMEETNPVSEPIPTDQVIEKLNLEFEEEGINDEDWEKLIENVALNTPKTASKLFFNQLFGGRQPKSVLGDLLAVILNSSMYTYKVAGPQAGIEKVIIQKVCQLIGYPNTADGTIAPGGSMSNFMGLVMGRDAASTDIPNAGVSKKMTLYTSKESHYSIPKNAAFAGIGRDQVRYIKTDSTGKMDIEHLNEIILEDKEKGFKPFFVNATAGTTVLGAFDDIEAIHKICQQHQIWLHVDGAYCGGVIFSKNYKRLVKGIELSDSFSFNAHKMLGTPLSCSIVIAKDKKFLSKSFSNEAEYLYQTDADDFDLGRTSLQCGRRNDALKFWTLWKSVGTIGLKKIIDQQFKLADVAIEYIRSNSNYTLYSYDDSISVCFNYKNTNPMELCTALYEHQVTVVGFGSFKEDTFVRFVTINANNSKEDILNFFSVLENFVENNPSLTKSKETISEQI
ncbi:MAG: aminotransferase class V-fold PLP-dependent enzyme [Bacteroidia bacterium]|nr:aminotransferase class V-fold PLP-dependent enzyme [Bacteroidia bacterium]